MILIVGFQVQITQMSSFKCFNIASFKHFTSTDISTGNDNNMMFLLL